MKTSASFSLLVLLALCVGLPAAPGNGERSKCPAHAGSCPKYPFRIGVECIKDMITVKCKNDTECASDEKCCSVPVCTTKCVKTATEKAGVCPKPGIMCDMLPVPRNCSGDSDCLGPQKCCRLPCSIGCANPVKPGNCPPMNLMCMNTTPPSTCKVDSDCMGNLKCCNRCGMHCVPPK